MGTKLGCNKQNCKSVNV